jgi:uncharacterized membrane protein (DUF4010 family)
MTIVDFQDAFGLLIATLGGAAVGLEREWSGHASGPHARFAGIRTFTLLGLESGAAGWLWSNGLQVPATVLVAGSAALIVAAYIAGSRAEVDGTTEVAAFVVLTAGLVAGVHEVRLASAMIALTTLLLIEKSRLHSLVRRIDDTSLRAGFRFAVMAIVILPILPPGPYGPLGGVRPRQLWALVLFFSALSFAGFIARRVVGSERGYPLAGMLGGIVSSTSVTYSFARTSRREPDSGNALAVGVIAACAVMCLRVLVTTAILNLGVSRALLPFLTVPFVAAAGITWWGMQRVKGPASTEAEPKNPLQFASALQMAALFQAVLFTVRWAEGRWGHPGAFVSAGVFGLTDVDALVVSMTGTQLPAKIAAQAITIGVLSNTLLKLSLGILLGSPHFRRVVAVGLSAVAMACGAALAWLR